MTTSNPTGSGTQPENPSTAATTWHHGWRPVICKRCDRRFLMPLEHAHVKEDLPRCPHCYHSDLVSLNEEDAHEDTLKPPELVLPVKLPERTLQGKLQAFSRSVRFPPADLNLGNLTNRLQRVFLPMWLVDAKIQASWEAEVGFDYEVVSHQSSYGDRRGWDTREVTETRIRWEPRLGTLKRAYQNVIAPALEEHESLKSSLGAFEPDQAQPYHTGQVEAACLRVPDRKPLDAWPAAVPGLQAAAAEECRLAASADHIRGFRWSPEYGGRNWTQLLAPVFTTYYLDDENAPQPLLIHGQTGKLQGRRRASMLRARRSAGIILAIAAGLFLLSLVAGGIGIVLPALLLPAGIGLFLALVVSLAAGIPIFIVWQFNRTEARNDPGASPLRQRNVYIENKKDRR